MENKMNIADRMAGLVVAAALVVVGAGFIVLGVSFFPVVGIFVGLAMLGLAWHFMSSKTYAFERIAGFLVPDNVMFHPGHGWARMEKSDTFTIGIDDFAAKLLGSVDSISLPELGSHVKQGALGWGFKADSRLIHMLSPVEGEVVAVNDAVANHPGKIFEDPYGKGWLFKVRSNNLVRDLKNMIPKGMVGEWLENVRQSLMHRGTAPAHAPLYADGGEPTRGFARVIDPEGWDNLARECFLTK